MTKQDLSSRSVTIRAENLSKIYGDFAALHSVSFEVRRGTVAAFLGPIAAGMVRDLTGSFDASLMLLPIVGIAMTIATFAVPESPGHVRSVRRAERGTP